MPPYSKKAKYTHKVVVNKNKFDDRSFRVITLKPGVKATIGCPNTPDGKSNWMSNKKRCKVGTRIQKIMSLRKTSKK